MQYQPITWAARGRSCSQSHENNKPAGSDAIVSKPLCDMMTLFNLVRDSECAPSYWREGLIVSLLKKGDKQDPGNQ